jgi:hypothetical protein
VKFSKLPLTILVIYTVFTFTSEAGYIPTGLELLESLRENVGETWFWLVVFCIFLEALVVISLYFPGQYIAALLVILSGPTLADIILLSFAMVVATTLGSTVNYLIGRYLSKETETKPISYKTLFPALIHSSGLAIYTFNWGLQKGTAKLIPMSFLLNTPYYLLILFTTIAFGEQIIAATDNPLIIGTALTIWLAISVWRDMKRNRQDGAAIHSQ